MGHYEGLISFALKFIGVHEVGVNRGPEVEMFQRAVDNIARGEPWCMAFVQYCVKEYSRQASLAVALYPSESCLDVWNKTDAKYRSREPKAGHVVIWQFKNGCAGHCGIVCVVGESIIQTIEGNTSGPKDAIIREGDVVASKTRSITGSRDMKIIGFIDPFGVIQ